ncbi:MAG: aminotransferase class V-fold PLP-dependent enzyme [Rhodospirillales bacterium]|nr:aminotransferase class V-fold PLP-dependent enzyme [Rhodospirillales bacterium]
MSLKAHFSRFLAADPERLHFAAHSHHLWPDVTFEAQQRCWNDAARLADRKWEAVFGEVYPAAQRHVARALGLSRPDTVAFGPNTHGFLLRLLSCLPPGQTIRVLTTDGEFHSFARQVRRLEEDGLAEIVRVPAEPFASFAERFAEQAGRGGHDLIYFSQVFYNSGYAVPDIAALVGAVADEEALVAVDGYHGFMALPTDLSKIESRAFYLAGGYKYVMAGEGVAFLHAPSGQGLRPRDTGWFAAFAALERGGRGEVAYGPEGARFLGATFDPVGLYRLNAVMEWLASLDLSVADIHQRVQALQADFVARLAGLGLASLRPDQLLVPLSEPNRGHFLTFRTQDAEAIHRRLLAAKVITDVRGDRLRLGFGLYHDGEDIERLIGVLARELS